MKLVCKVMTVHYLLTYIFRPYPIQCVLLTHTPRTRTKHLGHDPNGPIDSRWPNKSWVGSDTNLNLGWNWLNPYKTDLYGESCPPLINPFARLISSKVDSLTLPSMGKYVLPLKIKHHSGRLKCLYLPRFIFLICLS